MAALTKSVPIVRCGEEPALVVPIPAVAAGTYFEGAIVWLDHTGTPSGKARISTLAAGDRIAGICAETIVAGAADVSIPVYVTGVFAIGYATPVQVDCGKFLCGDASGTLTDNPADLDVLTLAANDAMLGVILAIENSKGIVRLQTGPIYSAAGWI